MLYLFLMSPNLLLQDYCLGYHCLCFVLVPDDWAWDGWSLFLSVGWEFSPLVTVGLSGSWKSVMTPETLTGMAPGSLKYLQVLSVDMKEW